MIEHDEKLICQVRKRLQESLFACDVDDDIETMRSKVIEAHDLLNQRANEIVENFLASTIE